MKKWKTGKIIWDSDLNRWNNLGLIPYDVNNVTFKKLINQKEYHPIAYHGDIHYNYHFGHNDSGYWLSFGDYSFTALYEDDLFQDNNLN